MSSVSDSIRHIKKWNYIEYWIVTLSRGCMKISKQNYPTKNFSLHDEWYRFSLLQVQTGTCLWFHFALNLRAAPPSAIEGGTRYLCWTLLSYNLKNQVIHTHMFTKYRPLQLVHCHLNFHKSTSFNIIPFITSSIQSICECLGHHVFDFNTDKRLITQNVVLEI